MADKLLPIAQLPGFVKDTDSGAILNTDVKAKQAYKERKKIMQSAADNALRLDKLENDIGDIKTMLGALLKRTDRT